MPRRNLRTSLRQRRQTHPMRAFDRLPAELRGWLAQARLPWSPQSVQRLWHSALRRCRGDRTLALAELTRAEDRSLARDARRVWGPAYPD
jgi:hypothetical protein